MAVEWQEMTATRRDELQGLGQGAHYTDTIIGFIGLEACHNLAANMPIPEDLLTDIVGSTAAAANPMNSSYGTITLDAEPTVVSVSGVHKLTENRCMVTCRFRGYQVE